MPKINIAVVVRDFQPGVGRLEDDGSIKPLDIGKFKVKAGPAVNILNSPLVDHIVIVSNRDPESKFGEGVNFNSHTPTWLAYKVRFHSHVYDGRIRPVFVDEWGANAGSGRAVQAGIDRALASEDVSHVMAWSPELKVDTARLAQAMGFLEHYNLDGIGFLREHCFQRPQWLLPQHTALVGTREFWELARIPEYADGDEGLMVDTEVGPCALAGMDDMARIFEALKIKPDLKIGMFGSSNPIPCDIDFTDPRQAEKITRQWAVVLEWARRSFPDKDPDTVISHFIEQLVII